MTVKELRDFLSQFPDDMEVVYQVFEEDSFNDINGGYVKKDSIDEDIVNISNHLRLSKSILEKL